MDAVEGAQFQALPAGDVVRVGRVPGGAGPGEVVVSRTIKDLVVGSGLRFDDRGLHALKGVPDEWQLFTTVAK